MIKNSRAAAGVGLITALVTLAACGGPAGGNGEGAPGVTADTIKVGLFGPMSGSAAVFGKGINTIDAMYKSINDAGGINGRKFEVIIEDDKCDPATARLAVTKLIEQDKVFMLHGGECSAAVTAAMPIIKKSGIPFLIAGAASHSLVDPPTKNVFHGWADNTGGTAADALFVTSFAASNGGKAKIAIVTQADEWGKGWTGSFKKQLEQAAGSNKVEIATELDIAPNTTDATAQVQQLKNADVDVAVVYAYPDPMSVFLRNKSAQSLDIPVVTGQGTYPEDQLDRLGNVAAIGSFFSSYCMSDTLDSQALKPYRDATKKFYPQDKFDLSSMLGASGVDVNQRVFTEMGNDITWANWISTAEKLKDLKSGGAPEAITYKPFAENDPSSRLGVSACKLATLDKQGKIQVIAPDWKAWKETAR